MIDSVRLKGFRRYVDETLVLGPGLNFVEGDNNAGKTDHLVRHRVRPVRARRGLQDPGAPSSGRA